MNTPYNGAALLAIPHPGEVPGAARTLDGMGGSHAARLPDGGGAVGESSRSGDSERWKERGVALRVFVYVFATHLFAGFVWILFYVGEHAKK